MSDGKLKTEHKGRLRLSLVAVSGKLNRIILKRSIDLNNLAV